MTRPAIDNGCMFTGLVENTGKVIWLRKTEKSTQLLLEAPELAGKLRIGESVAVNGACLTVTSRKGNRVSFDLLEETLQRTNLRQLRPEQTVNLERALALGDRLGGHFVLGHVDCVSQIRSFDQHGDDWRLEVAAPEEFAPLLIYKGSVAVNGISLTVAEAHRDHFVCWIIPHTREVTNLISAEANTAVNLEFDMLAKHVARILDFR